MARRPLTKTDNIATNVQSKEELASVNGPPTLVDPAIKFKKAALYKVDNKGNIISDNDVGKFLINPDSIDDVKSSNWIAHSIPGQSDPILQWVHGGPRVVSFDALVTRDTKYYADVTPNPLGALAAQALSAVGSIASSFAGVSIPIGDIIGKFNPSDVSSSIKLDISDYLDYYRSLLYPIYDSNNQLKGSPPLLVLYFNNSLGNAFTSGAYGSISPYSDFWVLTDLNIKITKQNPDLSPMEAMVGFKLLQYVITSRDTTYFGSYK